MTYNWYIDKNKNITSGIEWMMLWSSKETVAQYNLKNEFEKYFLKSK